MFLLFTESSHLIPKVTYTGNGPLVFISEPLTIDFIKTVCSDLLSDWIRFSKALGISHARVQAIKQQHCNVVSEKVVMDVIVSWIKTRAVSQDKVRKCR